MANFNVRLNPRLGKRERLAVSSVAVGFTPSAYTHTPAATSTSMGFVQERKATGAVIQVVGADEIYFTIDGTTPTALIGFKVGPGDFIALDSAQQVKNFQALRVTADTSLEACFHFGN